MNNLGGGAQIATLLLVFVMVLIGIEKSSRRHQQNFQPLASRFRPATRVQLIGFKGVFAALVCSLPVILSIGILLSYSKRLHPTRPMKISVGIASLGYAVPGAVLAIGVVIPFAAFDNAVDLFSQRFFGLSTGLLLSGTVFALIFAYTVRFLAVAFGSVNASMKKISPHMDDAARSLGHSPGTILRTVHLPLIRGGMLTAALVVFVDCMKELPATLVLRPFNFETLATQVYQYASDELIGQSALYALLIVIVGLVPVILLSVGIDRTKDINTD